MFALLLHDDQSIIDCPPDRKNILRRRLSNREKQAGAEENGDLSIHLSGNRQASSELS